MSAPTHADRGHAQWSASSSARNWTCAGAIAMATLAGPEKESIHAARGTAMHEVSELALRNNDQALNCLGMTVRTKEHEIEVDEETCDGAQMYVDYIRGRKFDWLMIEQNFRLDAIDPPFDAGGTCDAIGAALSERVLEVVDLKGGMGLVEATENKQLRTYALCALLNMAPDKLDFIDRIKVTIVQPRAPHKEGRIRSDEFHVADLVDWTNELKSVMAKSKAAFDAFKQINGNRVLFDEWSDKYLTPGACTFCPAEGFCPKLKKAALEHAPKIAQQWFEDPSVETPVDLTNMARIGSAEELAHDLDGFEMIENWIKARRAYAHAQAENGLAIPGWQLSDKIGNRKWAADEAKVAYDLAAVAGLGEDQIWTKKLASPAQIDKVLGAKRKDLIKSMWTNPVTGTNLVSTAKTTRPPAQSKPDKFFEQVS